MINIAKLRLSIAKLKVKLSLIECRRERLAYIKMAKGYKQNTIERKTLLAIIKQVKANEKMAVNILNDIIPKSINNF